MSQFVINNKPSLSPLDLEPSGQRSTPIVTLARVVNPPAVTFLHVIKPASY
jgi:hypothetical protein